MPLPSTVTLPSELAVKVPAEAVSVTVSASPSASLKTAAERSTSLEVSSVTSISVGRPETAGAEFVPVPEIVNV